MYKKKISSNAYRLYQAICHNFDKQISLAAYANFLAIKKNETIKKYIKQLEEAELVVAKECNGFYTFTVRENFLSEEVLNRILGNTAQAGADNVE